MDTDGGEAGAQHPMVQNEEGNSPVFVLGYGNPCREKWVTAEMCGRVVRVTVRGRVVAADPRLLKVQQNVEVWSESMQRWDTGKVLKIGEREGKGMGPGRREQAAPAPHVVE